MLFLPSVRVGRNLKTIYEMLIVKLPMEEKRIKKACALKMGTKSGDRPKSTVVKFL